LAKLIGSAAASTVVVFGALTASGLTATGSGAFYCTGAVSTSANVVGATATSSSSYSSQFNIILTLSFSISDVHF
jgi:hypothetical protein